MSHRMLEESYFDQQHAMQHNLSDMMFATYSEPGEEDLFKNFIEAIKMGDYARFRSILQANKHFATKIDPNTKQTAFFFTTLTPSEDVGLLMMKDLIAEGTNPGFTDDMNQNILYYIAKEGKSKLFLYLINHNVNVNIIDKLNQTPLFYSARDGRYELCKNLLDYGIDPNHIDSNQQTCLFYAAKNGHLDVCRLLVDYGCRHEHLDLNKQTALHWAKTSKNKDLVNFLKNLKSSAMPQAPGKIKKEVSVNSESTPKTTTTKAGPKKKMGTKEKEEHKNTYKLIYMQGSEKIDVSQTDFEIFKQKYPQLAEYLLNPDTIPLEEMEKKENWEKVAKKIILTLSRAKGASFFNQPVDPVKHGCIDYYQIIKSPMDLGTIKTRLHQGQYNKLREFVDDVDLVFKNCLLYNGNTSEVGRIGEAIHKEFKTLCKNNNVDNLLQDEIKSEARSEGGRPMMDMERHSVNDDMKFEVKSESKMKDDGPVNNVDHEDGGNNDFDLFDNFMNDSSGMKNDIFDF